MSGPAPKPPGMRQRRNKESTRSIIEAPPAERMELPKTYHANTVLWWTTIWDSPIADEWVDADVPGLLALAQLVEDFWTAPGDDRAKRHSEVRMASREFGLTPFSRRQLQWEVKRVEGPPKDAPAKAPTRRRDPRLKALG